MSSRHPETDGPARQYRWSFSGDVLGHPQRSLPRRGTVLGPYTIERRLGSGGMGAVYAARHQSLGVVRALKVLLPPAIELEAQHREARFLREAQSLAAVPPHRNVVRVHTYGVTPSGVGYCVLDLVQGQDLRQTLASGPLSLELAASVVEGVADGLAHAHRAGIIHRDVKPANILLRAEDSTPVLVDFGLARPAAPSDLTKTGQLLGTLGYMSPEQISGRTDLGPASDVFALGVVFFEILTLETPFPMSSFPEHIATVLSMDPPAVSSLRPDAPVVFDRIIAAALAKDPAERPSAAQIATALRAFRAGYEFQRGPD